MKRLVDGGASSPATATPTRFHLNPLDSGREICKVAFFSPENGISLRKNQLRTRRTRRRVRFYGCPAQVFRQTNAASGNDPEAVSDCQKKFFDSLVDGGASSPATATPTRFHLNPLDSGREISCGRDVHAAASDFMAVLHRFFDKLMPPRFFAQRHFCLTFSP